jgi:hypothetical protein
MNPVYSYPDQHGPTIEEYDPTQAGNIGASYIHPSPMDMGRGMHPPPSSSSYNMPYWAGASPQSMGNHPYNSTMRPLSTTPMVGGIAGVDGPLPGAYINPHFAMMQLLSGNGVLQNPGAPPTDNNRRELGNGFGPPR